MNEPILNWGVLAALFVATAALGAAFTFLFRRYAVTRSVMDIPNSRSSHATPVPRGGGMSIVVLVTVVSLLVGLYWQDRFFLSAGVAGAMVALVGWFDDHKPVRASIRLLIHISAVAAILWQAPDLRFVVMGVEVAGWIAKMASLLIGVWLINLYNFIDGIDGMAGAHAFLVGLWAATLFWLAYIEPGLAMAVTIAGASLGFLFFNWSPARVFMGDGGSGFLGFWFFVLLLYARSVDVTVLLLMPISVLVVDATATLLWRMATGERWYTAHREHVYQKLVRFGFSHRSVTLAYVVISVAATVIAYGLAGTSVGTFQSIAVVTLFLVVGWAGVQWLTTSRLRDKENDGLQTVDE